MEPVVKVNATSNIERFFIEQKQKCDGLMAECKSINVTSVFYIYFLFYYSKNEKETMKVS